ncbi:MAG: tetratricopeptide repeat protein [Alphaproteobacteria bacterium]|nr:tetratricopeptide repeat protein [Alphaproteobacteria bacterium]
MAESEENRSALPLPPEAEEPLRRLLAEAKPALAAGRHDEARAILLRAVEMATGQPTVPRSLPAQLNNLANAFAGSGRPREAVELFSRALAFHADYALAHANLATVLVGLGQIEQAVTHFERAEALSGPDSWRLYLQGAALQSLGRIDDARRCFAGALTLDPNNASALAADLQARLLVADWTDLATDTRRLVELVRRDRAYSVVNDVRPYAALFLDIDPAERCRIAETRAARDDQGAARPALRRHDAPLRIGYLSADFRRHPTAHLMLALFGAHDRSRVAIDAYSLGPPEDSAQRRRITADSDRFVDLHDRNDVDAAEQIRANGVDILVDLMSWTRHARPGIAARRPAPIQISYLGFPGTTGAAWIDYIIADPIVVPAPDRRWYTEKVITLPRCYQVNNPDQEIAPGPPARAEWSLPDDAFVFACFNLNNKIEPATFAAWMRILRKAPAAVLWLLADQAHGRRNLLAAAAANGVDPRRLIFADRAPRPVHLRRQQCADLFLDTFLCNAHTTASDALYMGLPVLTHPGDHFAGRVAASLLTTLGIEELIAPGIDSYCETAIDLARQPEKLAALSDRIAKAVAEGPLHDTQGFARDLERAYALVWRKAMAGQDPDHIIVPPAAP